MATDEFMGGCGMIGGDQGEVGITWDGVGVALEDLGLIKYTKLNNFYPSNHLSNRQTGHI